ncbi:hypothetical protein CN918_27140 [Priestia megaterium]|nr:hypothetical protein CN918_27140 [Priestia megaterium]
MRITELEKIINNHLVAHLKGVSRSWTDNIFGYSGNGKSALVKAISTANDCVLIKVPVAQLETADLVGTPHPVQIRPNLYVQMYALPNWLPHIRVDENNQEMYHTFDDGITRPLIDIDLLGAKVENRAELQKKLGDEWKDKVKGAVLFFDEINRAFDDQMKNGIFEFIENGRLHTYQSPWNTYRISAMNPPNTKYFVNEMTDDKAFAMRSIHYVLDATPEEWLRWAEERGINETIRDFIAADPSALMENEEPISLPNNRSPRSYEMLSVLMDETDFPTNPSTRKEIYHGIIGKDYGNNFAKHERQKFEKIPHPRDILLNYASVRPLLLEMKESRNDFLNMVNQYMLAFLSREDNAKFLFYSNEDAAKITNEEQYALYPYNEQAMDNFKTFVSDMYPSSKSTFMRKATNSPHMNAILINDISIYNMLEQESAEAYESE